MMRRLFLVFFNIFWLTTLSAQQDLPLRIELEMAKDASDYHYANAGPHGVFVFYEGNSRGTDSTSMIFMHYDTNLHKTYNFPITLPAQVQFITSTRTDSCLYLLFQQELSKKHPRRSVLVTIGLPAHEFASYMIEPLSDPDIVSMKAADDHLFIRSSGSKSEALYFYNCQTQRFRRFRADTTVTQIEFCEPDTFNRKLWVGAVLVTGAKTAALVLYELDYNGNVLNVQPFPIYGDYFYNSARLAVVDSTHVLVIGTYNTEQDRYSGNLHTGVYSLPVIESEFDVPSFYNYTQLRNRDTTLARKGKSQSLNMQLLIGNITSNGSQFAFVTEVFYPEYNYNDYNNYDSFYGGYYSMPSASTFAGYRMVNAYVTTFDAQGQLIWDHYLPFSNILTYRLAQRVSVFFTPENYALIYYPFNFSLTSTLVDGYNVVERINSMDLETLQRHDVVEYSRSPRMEKWYGESFLFSGAQYIKNTSKSARAKRYVFFLNKLEYR
jgi:hypothetical protein